MVYLEVLELPFSGDKSMPVSGLIFPVFGQWAPYFGYCTSYAFDLACSHSGSLLWSLSLCPPISWLRSLGNCVRVCGSLLLCR